MRVVVIGAGGHARSVIDALRSRPGELEPVACTDPDPARTGTDLDGIPVIGDDDRLEELRLDGVTGACLGVGGVGDNAPRAQIYARLRALGFALPPVIHARAVVSPSAHVGSASQIMAGAVIGPGAVIGENVVVNTGAIVEHDCRIEADVHVATRAALGGAVHVGTSAHIGIGASVIQGVRIGARAIVGAGAVVIRDVQAGTTAVGCPAAALPPTG